MNRLSYEILKGPTTAATLYYAIFDERVWS